MRKASLLHRLLGVIGAVLSSCRSLCLQTLSACGATFFATSFVDLLSIYKLVVGFHPRKK